MVIRCRKFYDCRTLPPREKRVLAAASKDLYNAAWDFTLEPNGETYVFSYDGVKPIGVIVFYICNRKGVESAELTTVFVLNKFRKKGSLKAMFNHIFKSHNKLTWTAILDAVDAYDALGGKSRDRRYSLLKEDFKANEARKRKERHTVKHREKHFEVDFG